VKISDDTLEILSALEFPQPDRVVIAERLDARTYKRVNDVLVTLGGAWSKKDKVHVFAGDARALIDQTIDAGEITTLREANSELGHFPTPGPLAAELVEMAEVGPKMRVLEPSAGDGAIVLALQDKGAIVTAVERSPVRRGNLLIRVLKSRDQLAPETDFMSYEADEPFDRCVMNPPFCRSGLGDHLDHVRRAYGMLKPRGLLVAVLPSSIRFRRDRRHEEMRTWCEERGTIEPLPEGSFRESGTGVCTVVVRLEAPPAPRRASPRPRAAKAGPS